MFLENSFNKLVKVFTGFENVDVTNLCKLLPNGKGAGRICEGVEREEVQYGKRTAIHIFTLIKHSGVKICNATTMLLHSRVYFLSRQNVHMVIPHCTVSLTFHEHTLVE